jgi:hypothetical protein
MISSRSWVVLLFSCCLTFASCNPVPFSGANERRLGRNSSRIPVTELYVRLPLEDIPTTIDEDVILSNSTSIRYGYLMGRPVTRVLANPLGKFLQPILGRFLSDIPSILHWGILISKEPPVSYNITGKLPRIGTRVARPETGLIFELRNSANTGLIYLDVKNWTTYIYRQDKVKYQGILNQTDEQLITLGRAYIQHVGREGFHNFYRNCQIFTTWYIKALWPKASISTRADQLLGKMLWWFKDWKKTFKWTADKVKGWLGFRVNNVEEIDSSAEFVDVPDLVDERSGSEPDNNIGENAEGVP